MKISCSPNGIVNRERPVQGVADIATVGFEKLFLDMSIYCSAYELEQYGRNYEQSDIVQGKAVIENLFLMREVFESMLFQCKQKQLEINIARAPYLLRNTKRTDLNKVLAQLTEESIKLCRKAGCGYIIVRPLFAGVEPGTEWELNREFYLEFMPVARENGVMILLENQCRDISGHLVRGICSDASIAAKWVDELNKAAGEERFGFCMDVGVCNLCGQNMQEFVDTLGERLKAVILRDCDGHEESSTLPFTSVSAGKSRTDWLSLIRGLRENGFDGHLILDMADTAAAFSPLLRPALLGLAKAVADYLKWQIEIENTLKKYKSIVLFGAGNMCRNYMKCYGEQYPPLFTCDNNSKLWGTSFCGLDVKSPEVLKELPEDCAVFICNIYYREIEMQLREMGVKNIAFFNDEYMPSFYCDRLKGV